MKMNLVSALRTAALAVAFFTLPLIASASSQPADPAAQSLQLTGRVPVKAAGPYVEIGTYQIQVTAKLGTPAIRLTDGSWLYPNFAVEDSQAAGTLLVRFNHGRVSELALLTPAAVIALQDKPQHSREKILIAAQERR